MVSDYYVFTEITYGLLISQLKQVSRFLHLSCDSVWYY